jgi:hypothetical protein
MDEHRVDWRELIFELHRCNLTLQDIAKHLGVTTETPRRWRNHNGEPLYKFGSRLIALWSEKTGKAKEDVPKLIQC